MMLKNDLKIGITGAGISGLTAGCLLQKQGYPVTIFESRDRTGGRIHSLNMQELIIESGPEFIHGNAKETIRLLQKYNISYVPIHGKMYRYGEGRLTESYEMAEGWDELLDQMKKIETDITIRHFLDTYFPAHVFPGLSESVIAFAEGFDLADPETASVKALIDEWEHEEAEQYRIPSGYGSLIKALENDFIKSGGTILLNDAVRGVNWKDSPIQMHMQRGGRFEVQKLIITSPVSLLTEKPGFDSILFSPIPEQQLHAAGQMGFGTVIKIILIWESNFWDKIAPDAQFIFSNLDIPTWWTQIPLPNRVLTGWLGGRKAEKMSDKPDIYILEKALETLSIIFSIPGNELKKRLKEFKIFNLKKDPWSRGAYSFSNIGYTSHKATLRQPVEKKLYFSGEANYTGRFPGTVEAAIVSAMETVKTLHDDFFNS